MPEAAASRDLTQFSQVLMLYQLVNEERCRYILGEMSRSAVAAGTASAKGRPHQRSADPSRRHQARHALRPFIVTAVGACTAAP